MEDPSQAPNGPESKRPAPLVVAAALVAAEAVILLVLALLEAVHVTSGRVTMGVTVAVFLALYGAGLLLCAGGLIRRQSWARGPVVLAQLIQLGLAWNFRAGSTVVVALALAVVAVIVLAALFSRGGIAALEAPDPD